MHSFFFKCAFSKATQWILEIVCFTLSNLPLAAMQTEKLHVIKVNCTLCVCVNSTGGRDYTELMEVLSDVRLVFEATSQQIRRKRKGGPEQCVNIAILADSIPEYDEEFQLMLTTADSAVILMPSNATVVIIDNDSKL